MDLSLPLSSHPVSSILIYVTFPSSFPCPHPSSFSVLLFCLLLLPFRLLVVSSSLSPPLLLPNLLHSFFFSFIIITLFSVFSFFHHPTLHLLFVSLSSISSSFAVFPFFLFFLFLYVSSSSSSHSSYSPRTEDSGLLTHKENLPVRALLLGDIRRPGSEAAYRVGPLRCHGDSRSTSGCLVTLDGEMTDHYI